MNRWQMSINKNKLGNNLSILSLIVVVDNFVGTLIHFSNVY